MQLARSSFGGLIRGRRVEAGITQQELARLAGLSVRALRDIERDRSRPRALSAQRLAAVLDLPDDDRKGQPPDHRLNTGESGLRLDILGPMAVRLDGAEVSDLSLARRDLLALLALHANDVVTIDEIVDTLWGERPPRTCRNVVHVHIRRLRAALGHGPAGEPLISAGNGYTIRVDRGGIDAGRFSDLLARAQAEEPGSMEAYRLLDEALGCWRGRVLADAGERVRQHPATIALANRRLTAALAFADTALVLRLPEQPITLLRRLAHDEPLHEGLHARLMLAMAANGERPTALVEYAGLRRRLRDELGIEPGPEARQVHLTLLHTDHADADGAGGGARRLDGVTPAQLPPDIAASAGRADQLRTLDEHLAGTASAAPILVISGTAGVGKTTLAVHWAHRVRARFPDGHLHVNLRGFDETTSQVTPAQALRCLLSALHVSPERVPADFDAQVALYRSLLAGQRMLIVLDNARDAGHVRPLLPASPGCLALITSRHRLTGLVTAEGAYPIALGLLSTGEARELLARRLGDHRLAAEPQAVARVVEHCAGLPLALSIVAAHVATAPSLTLSALADQAERMRDTLEAFATGDRATDLRTVFSWSYQALVPAAARLFRLLGLHAAPDLSAAAAAALAGISPREATPLLAELVRAHLIVEPVPGRYAFHDLLRVYARELAGELDGEPDRRAALGRMIGYHLHSAHAAALLLDPNRATFEPPPVPPGVTPEHPSDHDAGFAWLAAEREVLIALTGQAARTGFDRSACHLAWALTDFLNRCGRRHDSVSVQRIALDAATRQNDPYARAHACRSLAKALARLGRSDEAHTQYERARAEFAAIGDDAGQARCHRGLAVLHQRQGRLPDALDHCLQACELIRKTSDTVQLARALNALGWCQALLGKHREALVHCEEALRLQRGQADPPAEAGTWDSLGYIHRHLGDFVHSASCYQRAVDLNHALGDRPCEADALDALGDTHHAAGDHHAATAAWREALAIYDSLDHQAADTVRNKL
ncbi:BTAD domain-containing putative transcriptional regulator [Nonomuraea sp. NPDC049141]|uniref:BTAD domain-containing putative transcriptional regulator n=1 Tax=Nonomuraea sp. NPDC049141 TaxID=3155500 RepID=UPI0033DC4AD6